jgi:Dyp-type peroxidase family
LASTESGQKPWSICRTSPATHLEPARTGGDIVVQACADDPQVAVHAIRNLARIGFGKARVRWSQLGFGRTSSTSRTQQTARNLFGFKDGTNNLKAEDTALLDEHVWAGAGSHAGEAWMEGGSYLVARASGCTSRSGTAPRSANRKA